MISPTDIACLALTGAAGACFVVAAVQGHAERVEAETVARFEAEFSQAYGPTTREGGE